MEVLKSEGERVKVLKNNEHGSIIYHPVIEIPKHKRIFRTKKVSQKEILKTFLNVRGNGTRWKLQFAGRLKNIKLILKFNIYL